MNKYSEIQKQIDDLTVKMQDAAAGNKSLIVLESCANMIAWFTCFACKNRSEADKLVRLVVVMAESKIDKHEDEGQTNWSKDKSKTYN